MDLRVKTKLQELKCKCEDLFEWSSEAENEEDLPTLVEE